MNVRTEYAPGVITITDEDTGEILVFSLWGQLEHVKLYEISRKASEKRPLFADYC